MMHTNLESAQQKEIERLRDENRELVDRINVMCDDFDKNCEEAWKLAQTLRVALDAIHDACKLICPHAAMELTQDRQAPKRKRRT